jgi:hypothetical protein
MNKPKCVFCDKDLTEEKFREDYILIPWKNDPEDPESANKVARCVHKKCFNEFKVLNDLYELL